MSDSRNDVALVEKLVEGRKAILEQLEKVIVGQKDVIDEFLTALFSRGHCLIVGVPGLAKTLLVSSIARILDLQFNRIQFTPDLMPSDITGTDVVDQNMKTGERSFRFIHGPLFANIVLADEINRTPPKTQSALLQAMQEYRVTVSGNTYELPMPFFVLATQNPIEQEGTYPLPEAQLDRFFFQVNIHYPSADEEKQIVKQTTSGQEAELTKVLKSEEILKLQDIVRKVPVSDAVVDYAVKLVRLTRPKEADSPDFMKKWVQWGAGPRASQSLILGGKAMAVLNGRFTVSRQDIRKVAFPVLRHRIISNFLAEAEGISVEDIIAKLLEITSDE